VSGVVGVSTHTPALASRLTYGLGSLGPGASVHRRLGVNVGPASAARPSTAPSLASDRVRLEKSHVKEGCRTPYKSFRTPCPCGSSSRGSCEASRNWPPRKGGTPRSHSQWSCKSCERARRRGHEISRPRTRPEIRHGDRAGNLWKRSAGVLAGLNWPRSCSVKGVLK
jgi:hypothetical protein